MNVFDETIISNMNNVNTDALPEIRRKVFNYTKKYKKCTEIADLCFKLGNIHARVNDIVGAFECYENALNIYVNCDNSELKCAECFKSFSNIYIKYDVESSLKNLDICINLYSKNLGENCLENADCYFKKGICEEILNHWQNAKEYFTQSLEIYNKNLVCKESVDVADCYFNLGKVNLELDNDDEAMTCFKNSLDIYLKKLGNNHVNIGNNYNYIGEVYEKQGNFNVALENYSNSNKIFSINTGENSEEYMSSLLRIGRVYKKLENNKEAIFYLTNALEIRSHIPTKKNSEVFQLNYDIADIYIKMNECDKANDYLDSCMNLSSKTTDLVVLMCDLWLRYIEIVGQEISPKIQSLIQNYIDRLVDLKEEPYIIEIFLSLGKAFSKIGNSIKAIEIFQKAIVLYEKLKTFNTKPIQLKVCEIYNLLGMEYDKIKLYEESLDSFQKTLKIRKKTLGPDHLKTAGAYNNVAIALDKMNKLVDAIENWKQCMAIRIKKLPSDDIKIANSFYNLSIILFKMKDYDESIKYMKKSLSIYDERLGEMNISSADVQMNLGEIYRIMNNLPQAEETLQNAVKIYKSKLKNFSTNINFLKSISMLGCTYSDLKKYQLCINTITSYIKEIKAIVGENHMITIDALYELGLSYNEINDLENAQKTLSEINKNVVKNKWPEKKTKSFEILLHHLVNNL
jgi:tetratricopeptide (TPR) repeat protein